MIFINSPDAARSHNIEVGCSSKKKPIVWSFCFKVGHDVLKMVCQVFETRSEKTEGAAVIVSSTTTENRH
jgi:hypothetical protein